MIIALWIAVGVLFWFVCGYFAAKIEYSMYGPKDGEMTEAFFLGPFGLMWTAVVWMQRRDDFWRKFLRIKD